MNTLRATIAATTRRLRQDRLVSAILLAGMAAVVVGFVLCSSAFRSAYWTLAGLAKLSPHLPSFDGWFTDIDPVNGPVVGCVSLVGLWSTWPLTHTLRTRWFPEADSLTCWALAATLSGGVFLWAVQALAFARLFGWASGLSIPAISVVFLLTLGGVGLLLAGRPRQKDASVSTGFHGWRPPRGSRLPLALVLSTHVICLLIALSGPPIGGGDALRYHLPLVVRWIRDDALTMAPQFWQFSLPSNGEVLIWWLLRGGWESLAGVAMFPAGLLAAATVWGLVRCQRGSRFAATTAATAVLAAEVVADQMYRSFIDLFGTAFLAAGILALIIAGQAGLDRAQRRLLVLVGGLAMGISCGSKPVFWLLALLATLVLGVFHARRTENRRELKTLIPLFLAGALACSAFWFVRAATETGNPLYPIRWTAGHHVVLPGVDPESLIDRPPLRDQLTSLPNLVRFPGRILSVLLSVDAYDTDFAPLSVGLVLAGVLALGLSGAARRGVTRPPQRAILGTLSLTMLAALVLVLQFRTRYGMIYHLLALCWGPLVVAHLHRARPRTTEAILTAASAAACACILAAPLDSLFYRLHIRDLSRAAFYRLPAAVDTLPPGARIVNLTVNTRALNYPLYGRRLRNNVLDSLTAESMFPDLRPTLAQLQRAGVDYVYLRAPFPGEWNTLQDLELIYDDELDPKRTRRTPPSRIYRVPGGPPTRHQVRIRNRV